MMKYVNFTSLSLFLSNLFHFIFLFISFPCTNPIDLYRKTMALVPRPDPAILQDTVKDKVAIITGAARGIGFATASLLASHGARVILVDISEEALKHACSEIGLGSTYKTCDTSNWSDQEELFNWTVRTFGCVDIVVCNAAVNPEIALLQTQDVDKRREMSGMVEYNYLADEKTDDGTTRLKKPSTKIFDTNIDSIVYGLKLAIHHMKGRGRGGRIVIVGSAGSYVPVPSQPLYTASKHAVLGLVRSTSLIEEVLQSGISISMVAPWLTLTSMVEGLEATLAPHTLKSSPGDVAWAIAHAASAPAEAVNGKGLWVQGETISEVEGAYGRLAGELISPLNRF